jgi:hypothetical protein
MFGNIWLSSVLIVTAIFLTSSLYKSYDDTQQAKQIQENYEIISEIKILIAKQYNKNPQNVTRDEIIAHLPNGVNWEKVLLIDRNKSSNLSNKELVNELGKIEISEDEKLKLLVLKAKLKNILDTTTMVSDTTTKKYTFEVGFLKKNEISDDLDIEKSIEKAIYFLAQDILYATGTPNIDTVLTNILDELTPYDKLYQDFLQGTETSISDPELITRKKEYFKTKIIEKLALNETAVETRLYLLLKDK